MSEPLEPQTLFENLDPGVQFIRSERVEMMARRLIASQQDFELSGLRQALAGDLSLLFLENVKPFDQAVELPVCGVFSKAIKAGPVWRDLTGADAVTSQSTKARGMIPHSAGHPIDHRGENAVLWHYPERIRQIDALCDEAELRGIADAPSELAYLGIGLGWTLFLLEKARLGELNNRQPEDTWGTLAGSISAANCLTGVLPAIASLLHLHAQMRRRGIA
jgi:hypothetical protein